MKTFYNTTKLTGKALKIKTKQCKNQNDAILLIMRKGVKYTPFEVHALFERNIKRVPITSIRRAMTTLTEQGYLEKLDERKAGFYGMDNYCWVKQ